MPNTKFRGVKYYPISKETLLAGLATLSISKSKGIFLNVQR